MFAPHYTIMPNACGTLSLAFDGTSVITEVWGASSTPISLGAEPGRYRILLLIQLSPYGLYQITQQDQAAFANQRLSLDVIDQALALSLQQAFMTAASCKQLIESCEKVFYERITHPIICDGLLLAAKAIRDSHGQLPVKEIAREAHYSERHLNRLFLTQIGMSTKSYTRITRFHHVLKILQTSPCLFAFISQQAGYYDQAHLDKDFKLISGVSPKVFLTTMADFYYDGTETYHTISL